MQANERGGRKRALQPGRPLLVALLVFSVTTGAAIHVARGQFATPGAILTRSYSGQFFICAVRAGALSPRFTYWETNRNLARLQPMLLPTSCERIKQVLWRELGASGPWRGRVFLTLRAANSADDPVTITSEQFLDGWRYRVELPDILDRTRYVRAMVQVLLLEMANRNAGTHSAEIPTWLLEGLTQELLISSTKDELIPPPPQPGSDFMRPAASFTEVNTLRTNPLEQAHQKLCQSPPLTFQELSWPSADQVGATVSEVYRDSAQLLVDQLLSLRDGRACLRAMLDALPEHYNWQFAFLRAFHEYFQRPLDVEKWWALQVVQFTGRDLNQAWTRDESWQKLEDVIQSAVQVRLGTNDLPMRAEVTLQTIIGEWAEPQQTQALKAKTEELQLLESRVAPELVPVVEEYHRLIATYLDRRDHPGGVLPFRKKAARQRLTDETLQQLAALDQRRLALRPPASKPDKPPSTPEAPRRNPGLDYLNQARFTR